MAMGWVRVCAYSLAATWYMQAPGSSVVEHQACSPSMDGSVLREQMNIGQGPFRSIHVRGGADDP